MGCQRLWRLQSQAATSDRQPDPRAVTPWVLDPLLILPPSRRPPPPPPERCSCLYTAGEKDSSPSPPTARKAPGDWTSSPDCRLLALKPDSSYLRRRRGTFSTESLAPTHAPTGAPSGGQHPRRRGAAREARFPSSFAAEARGWERFRPARGGARLRTALEAPVATGVCGSPRSPLSVEEQAG